MYENDKRVVMTLDAGGTNFVFSAIQSCCEIISPIHKSAVSDNIDACLKVIVEGFSEVKKCLDIEPVAISFAFPGPADYENGIIGDLPNFPAFRGGIALGPYLSEVFNIPVFINNDGNLFAYGEALAGKLPEINRSLYDAGNSKRYKNLIGITLGTGFGAGVVIDKRLLTGDNGCGGDVWLMRNTNNQELIAEEGVSIRAVKRVYHELCDDSNNELTPKDIFDIAEGKLDGNKEAAVNSFKKLGKTAAAAIVNAINIVDGIVVIGGGLAGAAKYILPGFMEELKRPVSMITGEAFPSLQMKVYNLEEKDEAESFIKDNYIEIKIPHTDKYTKYSSDKKIGLCISSLGASKAVCLGAYAFALTQLDESNKSI